MIKLYSQQNVPTGIQAVIIVAQIKINFFQGTLVFLEARDDPG